MSLEERLGRLAALFTECADCNQAILRALDAGQAPEALGVLFQRKEALVGQLGALMPLQGDGTAAAALHQALDQTAQAQARAIRTESLLSAALLPHIPYHGKRVNFYQQPESPSLKSSLETEG